MNNRRIKRVPITTDLLLEWLKGGRVMETEIPDNATLAYAYFDGTYNCFMLVLESPEWDELQIGDVIPISDNIIITMRTVTE